MTATGLGKFTGGTGDDDLKYLARLDEVNSIKKNNKLDPKKFSVDLWEKPSDLKHKNAQFNISISDYKKMLKDYDQQKIQKQEETESQADSGQKIEFDAAVTSQTVLASWSYHYLTANVFS